MVVGALCDCCSPGSRLCCRLFLPLVRVGVSVGNQVGLFFFAYSLCNAGVSVAKLYAATVCLVESVLPWWAQSWGQFAYNSVLILCVLHLHCGHGCPYAVATVPAGFAAFVCGVVHGFVSIVLGILYLLLGFFCSANRFKYIWHSVAYWAYIVIAGCDGSSSMFSLGLRDPGQWEVGVLVALVLWGLLKLAGDVEEKSKIVIFSPSHFLAMHKDGEGVAAYILILLLKCFVGLACGLIEFLEARRQSQVVQIGEGNV